MHHKVVILGAGPAGYTAGLYAARGGLEPILVAGPLPGGQLVYTHNIENFPGFQTVPGLDLVDVFQKQVRDLGVDIVYETVERVDFSRSPLTLYLSGNQTMTADAVIIATGGSPRWLGVKNEEKFKGKGISICATCDGFFYRNKPVAVVGGGNTSLYEAIFLAGFASKVYVISRDDKLTGERALQRQVYDNPKIEVFKSTEVIAFEGDKKLTGMLVRDNELGTERVISVDGVFEAIGQDPNTGIFKGVLDLDSSGYIITDCVTKQTSVPGVFAAGDVQEPHFRQAIIACGSGAMAALGAEHYLLKE